MSTLACHMTSDEIAYNGYDVNDGIGTRRNIKHTFC